MRVVVNPEAAQMLASSPAFRDQLVAALEAADFSDACIVDGSGTAAGESELILKCAGGRALTVPMAAFSMPGIIERVVRGLR